MKILSTVLLVSLAISMVACFPDNYLRTLLDALEKIADSDATAKRGLYDDEDLVRKPGVFDWEDWSGNKNICGRHNQNQYYSGVCQQYEGTGKRRDIPQQLDTPDALGFLQAEKRKDVFESINEECCAEQCSKHEIQELC
ncbi:uncharacterized protein [Amphiura filiformis]|uniref:uncharacterized protein n=1 Tax=Amphiura filiformis TaxID=82378 RepID=UPI003B21C418